MENYKEKMNKPSKILPFRYNPVHTWIYLILVFFLHISMYVCVCVCIHRHTHTHTYIYIYAYRGIYDMNPLLLK